MVQLIRYYDTFKLHGESKKLELHSIASNSLAFFVDFHLKYITNFSQNVVRKVGEQRDAFQEVELVLHLLHAGGLHDLLEHDPLHAPQLPVSDGLDGGRPLAVVEDGQLSEGLANPEPAQNLPILDDFILSLGRDVDVGAQLPCKMIARL